MPGGVAAAAVINSYSRKKGKTTVYVKEDSSELKELSQKNQKLIEEVNSKISEENAVESERVCPECGKKFSLIEMKDQNIDYCRFCRSFWFDSGELMETTEVKTETPQSDLKYRLSKFKCPVCDSAMQEHIFIRTDNLLVDVCELHGIYLQSGELTRFLQIAEKNNL